VLAGLTLAGCSPIVATQPAADANNPQCANVMVHLPDTLQDLAQRETDAQATSAWGDPERVLLTCGVEVPSASELPCVEVDGVYWLRNDDADPLFVFTTFGRDPAVDVAVENTDEIAPGLVLGDLSDAIGLLPTNGLECTSVEDSLSG